MRLANLVIGAGLLAIGCGTPSPSDFAGGGTWEVHHLEDGGGLFSVWGSGPDDVWVAGGQVGHGLLLHSDGTAWTRVDTGAHELLWWVYGFGQEDVYAVGEGGLILHYDGERWRHVASGTDQTLYGVWGASGGDVWIVGGDPNGAAGSAVVLRGQGESFHMVDNLPEELLPSALYKVYGFHARDVIAVGTDGTVLRFDGDTWIRQPVPTTEPIFSMWARAEDDLYAVGGHGIGEILHFDGTEWSKVDAAGFDQGLSGVFTAPGFPTIAVGASSYVVEIAPDGLEVEPEMPLMYPAPSLHGVWADETGTAYAVGGDLFAYPDAMSGVILRRR